MPSSVRPNHDSGLRIRPAPPEITLHDWPLRDRPLSSLVALTFVAGMSWLAAWAMETLWIGALVAFLLALTVWRTWLPVSYHIGASGITQSVFGWQRRIPWMSVVHYEILSDGVLLLPDATGSPLARLRGLYVHWGERRDEVLAHVQYYLEHWTSTTQNHRS